ncbi:Metalloenzyme, LuxS/M16 peptidase-like protein [Lipomyces arxii]|uniref:Metalloenzyme, LuxS/M16 peptidase-like protein n=1 Tax=Lipomyces arxii TaxID=56418 RepID=UPI0034CD8CE3
MYRRIGIRQQNILGQPGLSASRRCFSQSAPKKSTAELFKVTTLPNGLRVATDGPHGHFAALGLYVDAGSRYEGTTHTGLSHMMDRMAFQSTKGYSADQMQARLSQHGGSYMCVSSRESIIYQAAVFNKDVSSMFELLSATVRWPEIKEEELIVQKETAQYEIGEIWQKPDLILPEILHTVAYKDNTLGLPLLCPEERLPTIQKNDVQSYIDKFYVPERIVAAFVGIDHETAVELATKQFGDMPCGTIPVEYEVARYTGGSLSLPEMPQNIPNQPDLATLYFAFEGLSINDPDIYALATLQTLLGGGGSFSAGGPGKGMYSRLYTNVLNRYGFMETCAAFNHSYSDSGLFGVMVSCLPEYASMVPAIISTQLAYCMSKFVGGLTKIEVERAKNQLRSSLLMNLESKMTELEDLGRQVQVSGRKVPVAEMSANIEKLTVADIMNVARRVFRGQVNSTGHASVSPTIVTQGKEGVFGDILGECKKHGLAS